MPQSTIIGRGRRKKLSRVLQRLSKAIPVPGGGYEYGIEVLETSDVLAANQPVIVCDEE